MVPASRSKRWAKMVENPMQALLAAAVLALLTIGFTSINGRINDSNDRIDETNERITRLDERLEARSPRLH